MVNRRGYGLLKRVRSVSAPPLGRCCRDLHHLDDHRLIQVVLLLLVGCFGTGARAAGRRTFYPRGRGRHAQLQADRVGNSTLVPNADVAGPMVRLVFFILVAPSGLVPDQARLGWRCSSVLPDPAPVSWRWCTSSTASGRVGVERPPRDRRLVPSASSSACGAGTGHPSGGERSARASRGRLEEDGDRRRPTVPLPPRHLRRHRPRAAGGDHVVGPDRHLCRARGALLPAGPGPVRPRPAHRRPRGGPAAQRPPDARGGLRAPALGAVLHHGEHPPRRRGGGLHRRGLRRPHAHHVVGAGAPGRGDGAPDAGNRAPVDGR